MKTEVEIAYQKRGHKLSIKSLHKVTLNIVPRAGESIRFVQRGEIKNYVVQSVDHVMSDYDDGDNPISTLHCVRVFVKDLIIE